MKTLCQILSVLIGLFAAIWMFIGIIPFLGALNWLVLPLCVVGIIFGVFPERKIGFTINVAVGIVGLVRLVMGGGAF